MPKGPKKKGKESGISFRCSKDYKQWAEAFADSRHRSLSSLIEAALAAYAEKKRYGVKPPKRG